MILVDRVTKKFASKTKETLALDNVSFKASKGEIIGFLGPNGAGKTTTMRLLTGVYKPTLGNITIDNFSPTENRLEIVKRIGYLPENNPLYPEMTVNEYLNFIASLKEEKDLDTVINQVVLSDVLHSRIEVLSRGYKQRVGMAAALIGNPKILILDEPTSGLDPIEQEKIRHLIKKIARNKSIIFSTHILSEVEDVANRLIIINKGKIAYDGKKPKGKGAVEKLFKKLVKN